MKYVIIGNSAGAVGCIEGIRKYDAESEIVLIASEPYHTYSRPLISYLLLGTTDEEHMRYRPADFYEHNKVTAMLGREVTAIDPAAKEVRLADGAVVDYDKLLAAVGSNPFVPPTKGLDTVQNCFTFMSLADAKALAQVLQPDSRVLVVGAGLIGLKCVEGIAGRVGSVTVVDLADRVLSSILNEEAAPIIQRYLEAKGINFIMGDCVAEFKGNCALLQKSGQKLDFDILVMAVGVRPNTGLLAAAGAGVDRGVLVDETCRTTLPDIYAAGDCTQGYEAISGEQRILALLPNAYFQGACAGANMAGHPEEFKTGIAMNSIGFWGKHIMTAGVYEGERYIEHTGQGSADEAYKCLFVQDNRLVGFILIGEVARAGIYTRLIREQRDLAELDFELLKSKPQLMAFARAERREQLGGKEA